MSDRDYNSPEYDRADYDRPNYETAEEYNKARREREAKLAEEGSNPYESAYDYNSFNDNTYGKTSYRGYYESEMTDASGKPLKNYFALKLTISIMMIIGCCCSNFLMVILGIIALVFTCKANTAYNERNAESFKKQSKISTICLGIGGGVFVINVILVIIVFLFAFLEFEDTTGKNLWDIIEMEGDWFEDFDDYDGLEEPTYEEEYFDERTTVLPAGYADFIWKNEKFSLPMSYDDFQRTGFVLEDFSTKTELEPEDMEFYSFRMENGYYGTVCFTNYEEETVGITECVIDYLYFYNDEYGELDITFFDGLTWGCSVDDVNAFLGEPQYVSSQIYAEDDVYQTVSWSYYENDLFQSVVISFDNDKMYSVTLEFSGE